MKKEIVVALLLSSFIMTGCFSNIKISIEPISDYELNKEEYKGDINNVEKDGYSYPVIYQLDIDQFYNFYNDKSIDYLEKVTSQVNGTKFTYKYKNGFFYRLSFSQPPEVESGTQFNEGEYQITSSFFSFWKKDNLQKLIKKYLDKDITIDNVAIVRVIYGNSTGGELIGWIKSGQENYFVTWDMSLRENAFYKKYVNKHYYINSNYNYIGVYDENGFNDKYSIKKGVLKNGKNEIIDEEDIFFKYGYAYTPVDKIMECLGFKTEWISDNQLRISKESNVYTLEIGGENQGTYYIDCYNEDDNSPMWEFVYCKKINNKFITNSDYLSDITESLGGSFYVDFDNNVLIIK